MTRRTLESRIAKREGNKVQISIGNIREILKIIIEMEAEAEKPGDSPLDVLADEAWKKMERMQKKRRAK